MVTIYNTVIWFIVECYGEQNSTSYYNLPIQGSITFCLEITEKRQLQFAWHYSLDSNACKFLYLRLMQYVLIMSPNLLPTHYSFPSKASKSCVSHIRKIIPSKYVSMLPYKMFFIYLSLNSAALFLLKTIGLNLIPDSKIIPMASF